MKLPIRVLILVTFLVSCNSRISSWVLISPKSEESWMIGLNSDFTKLWLGKPFLEAVTTLQLQNLPEIKFQVTELPETDALSRFCPNSSILISADNNLYEYSDEIDSWIPIYDSFQTLRKCKLAPDGTISFIEGEYVISSIKNGSVVNFEFPNGKIRDFAWDANDRMYVLSEDDRIYKNTELGWQEEHSLSAMGIPDGFNIFITPSNVLWIESSYGMYRWPSTENQDKALLLIPATSRPITNLYESDSGKIYIIALTGIWEISDHQCKEIELPIGAERIYSSAFNSIEHILFISTDAGLFYQDILNAKYKSNREKGLTCIQE